MSNAYVIHPKILASYEARTRKRFSQEEIRRLEKMAGSFAEQLAQAPTPGYRDYYLRKEAAMKESEIDVDTVDANGRESLGTTHMGTTSHANGEADVGVTAGEAQRVTLGDVYRDRLLGTQGIATMRSERLLESVIVMLVHLYRGELVRCLVAESCLDFVEKGPDLSKPCVDDGGTGDEAEVEKDKALSERRGAPYAGAEMIVE